MNFQENDSKSKRKNVRLGNVGFKTKNGKVYKKKKRCL